MTSEIHAPPTTATIDDVAQRVGVSTRTVRRVLNNLDGYSDATAARVRTAVTELGYYPNHLARALRKGRSGIIGLVASTMTDPFFSEMGEAVQRAARESGLVIFFASTDRDRDQQLSVLTSLGSHNADGLIIFPAQGAVDDVERFASHGTPTVMIDHPATGLNLSSVSAGMYDGAHEATQHLIDRGCTQIAMLSSKHSHARRREGGYRNALEPGSDPIVELAEPTAEGGRTAMHTVLGRNPTVDGVFAYNDLMAMGALRALHEANRSVPQDVAVVGFGNTNVSPATVPSLSTIHHDPLLVGRKAFELLSRMMSEPNSAHQPIEITLAVIERQSA